MKINDKVYCLASFAKEYGFSYSKVRRLHKLGYHNENLLKVLQDQENQEIIIGNKKFKNRLEAANYYQIPSTTFYRNYKSNKIEKLIKKRKRK
ncbi:MAG: hypothetical protein HDS11_04230 [Bacteroides sp.]|nr:hypothetical protein [Bacteroides sp.]